MNPYHLKSILLFISYYFNEIFTEGAVVKAMFTSHTQWVQTVRWSNVDYHLFLSGAYDNEVKLWDIRRYIYPYNIGISLMAVQIES